MPDPPPSRSRGAPAKPLQRKANSVPAIPESRHDLRVLSAIRRIIRAADMFSRRLAANQGITVPQLVCLTKVVQTGGITIKDLAREIFLSPSTVVGIIDRLEMRQLVERRRSEPDKRLVCVVPTPEGRRLVKRSPSPLHENLVAGLRRISPRNQKKIADAIEQLVSLMEIEQVDAAPILETTSELDRTLP